MQEAKNIGYPFEANLDLDHRAFVFAFQEQIAAPRAFCMPGAELGAAQVFPSEILAGRGAWKKTAGGEEPVPGLLTDLFSFSLPMVPLVYFANAPSFKRGPRAANVAWQTRRAKPRGILRSGSVGFRTYSARGWSPPCSSSRLASGASKAADLAAPRPEHELSFAPTWAPTKICK